MRKRGPYFIAIGFAVVIAATMGSSAQAQRRSRAPDFHGRDFRRFSPRERTIWRGGRWFHGRHDGLNAWWWLVAGRWYFYPEPIYPYPTYVPPAMVIQQAPPAPAGIPPTQYWYYCDRPQGYYPYVASCNVPWRPVPVTPPPR